MNIGLRIGNVFEIHFNVEGLTQGAADHNKETLRFRHLEQKYICLSTSEALIIIFIAMARLRSVGGYNDLSPSERPQNRLVGCQAFTCSQEPGSKRGISVISEPDHCFSWDNSAYTT